MDTRERLEQELRKAATRLRQLDGAEVIEMTPGVVGDNTPYSDEEDEIQASERREMGYATRELLVDRINRLIAALAERAADARDVPGVYLRPEEPLVFLRPQHPGVVRQLAARVGPYLNFGFKRVFGIFFNQQIAVIVFMEKGMKHFPEILTDILESGIEPFRSGLIDLPDGLPHLFFGLLQIVDLVFVELKTLFLFLKLLNGKRVYIPDAVKFLP